MWVREKEKPVWRQRHGAWYVEIEWRKTALLSTFTFQCQFSVTDSSTCGGYRAGPLFDLCNKTFTAAWISIAVWIIDFSPSTVTRQLKSSIRAPLSQLVVKCRSYKRLLFHRTGSSKEKSLAVSSRVQNKLWHFHSPHFRILFCSNPEKTRFIPDGTAQ